MESFLKGSNVEAGPLYRRLDEPDKTFVKEIMCTCGSTDSVVIENYLTCLDCGNMMKYEPKWVMSYACPQFFYRKCYYSRIKRFQKKLLEMKSNVIGDWTEDILCLYSAIEFKFNMKRNKERKYFFSQKVVLFFILAKLGIDLIVPVLKNPDRTETQLKSMAELLE